MITVESLTARIVELKTELEKYVAQANANIAHTNGRIAMLEQLRDELNAELANAERVAPTP